MAAPCSVTFVKQERDYDCGIACLAMVLDEPYADVYAAASQTLKKWPDPDGITSRQLCSIAKKLSHPVTSMDPKGVINWAHETGVLLVGGGRHYHFVVVFQGAILEPTFGKVWDFETYLTLHKLKMVRFIRV
jgi:ABC-type bacteriocin/lantibiotic exporter with double-glycine peptidase domain